MSVGVLLTSVFRITERCAPPARWHSSATTGGLRGTEHPLRPVDDVRVSPPTLAGRLRLSAITGIVRDAAKEQALLGE